MNQIRELTKKLEKVHAELGNFKAGKKKSEIKRLTQERSHPPAPVWGVSENAISEATATVLQIVRSEDIEYLIPTGKSSTPQSVALPVALPSPDTLSTTTTEGSIKKGRPLGVKNGQGKTKRTSDDLDVPSSHLSLAVPADVSHQASADTLPSLHNNQLQQIANMMFEAPPPPRGDDAVHSPLNRTDDSLEYCDNVQSALASSSRDEYLEDLTGSKITSKVDKEKNVGDKDSLNGSQRSAFSTVSKKRKATIEVDESSSFHRVDSSASLVASSTDLSDLFRAHSSPVVTKKRSHQKKAAVSASDILFVDNIAKRARGVIPSVDDRDNSSTSAKVVVSLPKTLKTLEDHCAMVARSTSLVKEQQLSLNHIVKCALKKGNTYAVLMSQGVVEKLVETMHTNGAEDTTILHKSLVILNTLIADSSPSQFAEIMSFDLVPRLVEMMGTSSGVVLEQVVWILDNIAMDFGEFRQQELEAGVLPKVFRAIAAKHSDKRLVTNLVGLLNHLTDISVKTPTVPEAQAKKMVSVLAQVVISPVNSDALVHACCALTNITHKVENQVIINAVFEHEGLTSSLIQTVTTSTHSSAAQLHALNHMKQLVEHGLLTALATLITGKAAVIARTACHALSNLCAGTSDVIQKVIDADLFPLLNSLTEKSPDLEVREFAANAVMYAFHDADLLQTQYLVDNGSLLRVVAVLKARNVTAENADLICEALVCVDKVLYKLECVSDFDHVAALIDAVGGWQSVERLRMCKVEKVRELAVTLDHDVLRCAVENFEQNID
eukprot:gene23636-29876_t